MHNVSACLHKSSLCSAFKRRSSDNLTSAIVADTIATDQPTCCTHCVVTVKQPYSTIICDKTLLEKINNSIWLTISKFFFNIYYIIHSIFINSKSQETVTFPLGQREKGCIRFVVPRVSNSCETFQATKIPRCENTARQTISFSFIFEKAFSHTGAHAGTFFAAYGGAVSSNTCAGNTLMCQIDGPFRN